MGRVLFASSCEYLGAARKRLAFEGLGDLLEGVALGFDDEEVEQDEGDDDDGEAEIEVVMNDE